MLNIKDLQGSGLSLDAPAVPPPPAAQDRSTPWPLETGSPAAVALLRVWKGEALTIIDAPPGSGKSHTIVALVNNLVLRAGLAVTVACPTRAQAVAIAHRLADALPQRSVNLVMSGDRDAKFSTGGAVDVRTLASLRMSTGAQKGHILIVDEAYQATFADVANAADGATQLVLVGDPGQIGPVVTADVAGWVGVHSPPHARAPEVFARRSYARTLHLDRTYRLGPVTTEAIRGLYSFDFSSVRPHRYVSIEGRQAPEVATLALPDALTPDDPAMLAMIFERARELVLHATMTDGAGTRSLTERDVALVCAHNSQVGILTGMLRSAGVAATVGTADRLQGGEWAAVVALDPAAGVEHATTHHTSLGRLCVMASRHTAHLTWAFTPSCRKVIEGAEHPPAEKARGLAVRDALTAAPAAWTPRSGTGPT